MARNKSIYPKIFTSSKVRGLCLIIIGQLAKKKNNNNKKQKTEIKKIKMLQKRPSCL